jgi:hypothetical protein
MPSKGVSYLMHRECICAQLGSNIGGVGSKVILGRWQSVFYDCISTNVLNYGILDW